ncbi:uncharacterized protein LOC124942925 [Impatiens glandulifera]|uniref:uncharacterized protein LOC124942925 n=1 Tax=Impatiens glandulifera TaxID=253017 RepID=UPI001FB0B4D3|nr:uncharacterized protein LOC124942925 [Impatiens glandulifera]
MANINGNKSPRPDGFNAEFFKANWDIVGYDITEECVSTSRFVVCVNGVHGGYIEGENRVRQGDPLSSYIFVLIMEVFESVLTTFRKNHHYTFHPFYEEEKITHLCFVDDLFILAHADVETIQTIKDALNFFFDITGLSINVDNSSTFYGGVNDETKARIQDIMSIPEGSFSVRYLGILLTARQIHVVHCRPLIVKVKNVIMSWATNKLSYAGMIELVGSVVMGLIGYWSQQIVLPKKVMRELDTLLRDFIWGSHGRGGKKVGWTDVCKPKDEGGVGLKNCVEWNRAITYKHLWSLQSK